MRIGPHWLFWIRGNADPDPRTRKLTKIRVPVPNKPEFQTLKKAFVGTALHRYVDMLYELHIKYIFHAKIELTEKAKSGQHPDPHWFGSIDPNPH